MRYKYLIWKFVHNGQEHEFGPCYHEDEGRFAFKEKFGFWPGSAIDSRPWDGIFDNIHLYDDVKEEK